MSKNALTIQINFKLGFRAQEMALLRIREIATLSDEFTWDYKIKDVRAVATASVSASTLMAHALLTDLAVQRLGQRVGLTTDAVQFNPQSVALGQRFIAKLLTLGGQCLGHLLLGVGLGVRQVFLDSSATNFTGLPKAHGKC